MNRKIRVEIRVEETETEKDGGDWYIPKEDGCIFVSLSRDVSLEQYLRNLLSTAENGVT